MARRLAIIPKDVSRVTVEKQFYRCISGAALARLLVSRLFIPQNVHSRSSWRTGSVALYTASRHCVDLPFK